MSSSINEPSPFRLESADRLMLVENFHRVANEASAALASLHLMRSSRGQRARSRLLAAAMQRLEGFGEINRLLSLSFGPTVDLGNALDRLAGAVVAGRMVGNGGRLVLDVARTNVAGDAARTVLLIAYELLVNAVRHVLEIHGGELVVRLRRSGTDLVLQVQDDGPGLSAATKTSGTGLGSGIVAELVRRCGGRIECTSDALGTAYRVVVPASGRTWPDEPF